ncbi:MAG: hypothetical protein IJ520_09935 [Synergistaceae bacterium]|nr:hypothetical protein [Synergistaceae bacterium]
MKLDYAELRSVGITEIEIGDLADKKRGASARCALQLLRVTLPLSMAALYHKTGQSASFSEF